jgi:hypothetical protein
MKFVAGLAPTAGLAVTVCAVWFGCLTGLTGASVRSKAVRWLFNAKDLKRLAAIAKRRTPGTKVSMLIRQAISEFLERNDKEGIRH